MMSIPFIKKYEPKSILDIPQQFAVQKLKEFVANHKQHKKKAALIYGSSGTCKSCAVYAVARELDLELIEVNASDFRNSAEIESKIGQALKQQSLFSQCKLILVDEIDGISGVQDRGGVPALAGLIADAKFPVVMTANDPWDSKFSSLRSKSLMIEFPLIDVNAMVAILKHICDAEKISYEESLLRSIARRCSGDLRGAINDLQVLACDKVLHAEKLSQDLSRDRVDNMINALMKIFKSSDVSVAAGAFDAIEEDVNQRMLWLQENVHKEYSNCGDLSRAYDFLSRADVFIGRVHRRQHWRFLYYANALMTAGVAVAKSEKSKSFVKYTPTMRLLKIWQNNRKYAARNSIVEKLCAATHCSKSKTLQSGLPFFKHSFKNNADFAAGFARALKLEEEESEWMMG